MLLPYFSKSWKIQVICILYIIQGLKAIHSPLTGIIDYGLVARTYGKEFEGRGGTVYTNYEVTAFTSSSGKFK